MSGEGSEEVRLSINEAYEAMAYFLDAYWERGGKTSDDIASLLSSLSISGDGHPLDPAMTEDWLRAVRVVSEKGPPQR